MYAYNVVVTSTNILFSEPTSGVFRIVHDLFGHFKEGVYVLEVINGSGEVMKEIDRRLRVIDLVIRHMIVRVDEERSVVERTRSKRQAESERRRVKRGLPPQRQPGEGRGGDRDDQDDDRFEGMES